MAVSSPIVFTTALVLALTLSSVAAASDCVVLDPARDSLSAEEQRAAQVLLEDALTAVGYAVSPAPCASTWTVSHTRLGESVTVRLSQGGKSDQLTVTRIEELPVAYERLVRALQTGQSVAATADRNSVTVAEESPRRMQADALAYLQLGGGVTGLDNIVGGTAFGGGYRHSLDKLAIDVGILHFILPTDMEEEEDQQFTVNLLSLSVLSYFSGDAASSLYAGGGLGYGITTNPSGVQSGLQVQGIVGYELLRQSTIRLFPQLEVTLPVYRIDDTDWVPSAALTLNVAFQPPQQSVPWWRR